MLSRIQGLVCPVVTPFDEAGDIDHQALRQLVDFLLAHGVQVLFPGGSTGEGPLLTVEERKALAETVLDQTGDRVPVIVHSGCMTSRETVELTVHARDAGATAVSMITPYFFTFTDDALFEHYRTVARAVPDFPIFIYVFPGNAKNDVAAPLLRRLRAEVPNIVGIKSSNTDLLRFQEYIEVGGDGFVPLCGVDGLMLPALAVGSRGQVSGNANVAPELFRALYDAFAGGDLDEARRLQRRINRLRSILKDGLHPAYFKAALSLRGVDAGYVRAPMQEMRQEEVNELQGALTEFGILV